MKAEERARLRKNTRDRRATFRADTVRSLLDEVDRLRAGVEALAKDIAGPWAKRDTAWIVGQVETRLPALLSDTTTEAVEFSPGAFITGWTDTEPDAALRPGGEDRCICNPAEVENGVCVLCGKPFPVGGSV